MAILRAFLGAIAAAIVLFITAVLYDWLGCCSDTWLWIELWGGTNWAIILGCAIFVGAITGGFWGRK